MTTTYTTAAQDAAAIRKAFKAKGWTSRDISVRSDSYSMGSSIDIKVKRRGIDLATVKAIAETFERVRRCELTGETLSGGNRFVSVGYDYDLVSGIAAAIRPEVETLLSSLKASPNKSHRFKGLDLYFEASSHRGPLVHRLDGRGAFGQVYADLGSVARWIADYLVTLPADPA